MFDIGFSEIFVVAIVALLVLGPERLPKAARFAGLWVRRARAQWYSVKAELESELSDDDLKRSLQQTRQDLREARDALAQGGAAMQREFEQTGSEMTEALRDIGQDEATPLGSASELEEPPPPVEDESEQAPTADASGPVAEEPQLEHAPEHAREQEHEPDARR